MHVIKSRMKETAAIKEQMVVPNVVILSLVPQTQRPSIYTQQGMSVKSMRVILVKRNLTSFYSGNSKTINRLNYYVV